MKRKGKQIGCAKKNICAILFLSFSFVIFCSAGLLNCPKGFFWNHSISQGVAAGDSAPCHNFSDGKTSEDTESADPCQCMEISKTEESSQTLEFANLLRISLQTIFLIPKFELKAVGFVFQTYQRPPFVLKINSQIHQKTIKLLI